MTSNGSWFSRFRRRGSGPDRGNDIPCDEVREHGSDYIDHECEEEIRASIMTHLGLCRDCDSWLKSLAQTVGLLRESKQVEVPEATMERIRAISRRK